MPVSRQTELKSKLLPFLLPPAVLPALLLALLLLFMAVPIHAASAQEATPPPDDAVNAVAAQIYCPVCDGVTLDACETKACEQWREDIRDRLAAGWTEEEILGYFAEQYGDQVLAAPPPRGFSLLIYIVPAAGIVTGAFFLTRSIWRWRTQGQEEARTSIRVPNQEAKTADGKHDAEHTGE